MTTKNEDMRAIPEVGAMVQVERLGMCRVVRVHEFGTMDVEAPNHAFYRVSGWTVVGWRTMVQLRPCFETSAGEGRGA